MPWKTTGKERELLATVLVDYGELNTLLSCPSRRGTTSYQSTKREKNKSNARNGKTPHCRPRLGLPRPSCWCGRPPALITLRRGRERGDPPAIHDLRPSFTLGRATAPLWSSPFPPSRSCLRPELREARWSHCFYPSYQLGSAVACINVGVGDAILTTFIFLGMAGGEAGPPLARPRLLGRRQVIYRLPETALQQIRL